MNDSDFSPLPSPSEPLLSVSSGLPQPGDPMLPRSRGRVVAWASRALSVPLRPAQIVAIVADAAAAIAHDGRAAVVFIPRRMPAGGLETIAEPSTERLLRNAHAKSPILCSHGIEIHGEWFHRDLNESIARRLRDAFGGQCELSPVVWHDRVIGVVAISSPTSDGDSTLGPLAMVLAEQMAIALRLASYTESDRHRAAKTSSTAARPSSAGTKPLDASQDKAAPNAAAGTSAASSHPDDTKLIDDAVEFSGSGKMPFAEVDGWVQTNIDQTDPAAPADIRRSSGHEQAGDDNRAGDDLPTGQQTPPNRDSPAVDRDSSGKEDRQNDDNPSSEASSDNPRLDTQTLLSSVAHDLRSPLSVIDMYCQLLSAEAASTMADPIQRMRLACRHINAMIGNLLDYGRLNSSVQTTALRSDPPSRTIREAIELSCQNQYQGRIINFADRDVPRAVHDPDLLRQVLVNLITNALKFSGGDSEVTIRCQTYLTDDTLDSTSIVPRRLMGIDVIDRGPGIEPDSLTKIFQPYYRTVTGDQFAGTGLGLAISHVLTERMNGRLKVQSEVGVGTTFTILLPMPGGR